MKAKKTTSSGIEVILNDYEVQVKYSKHSICITCFSTKEQARKEFNKHRQGRNKL